MNKLFTIFFFIFCVKAHAAPVPMPRSVLSINDIAEEFRGPLRSKISLLPENYIVDYKGQQVIMTSHETTTCLWEPLEAGSTLAKLEFFHTEKNGELIETANYGGCNGSLSLKEVIITKGKNLKPITFKQFIKGQRDFTLKDEQTDMLYRLINDEGLELFRFQQSRNAKGLNVSFFILGHNFLSMNYEYKEDLTRLVVTYKSYAAAYVRIWSAWRYVPSFPGQFSQTILAYRTPVNKVEYLNSKNSRMSQSSFQKVFNKNAVQDGFSRVSAFVKFHNFWFPSTEVAQVGGQNKELLNELRLMFTRLLNNSELNLVRNKIQEYIKAADEGKLVDLRPKN